MWKLAAFDLTASLILSLSRLATWLLITLLLSSKPESLIIPGITDVIEVTNEELPVSILPKASESDETVIGRSLVACLVSANEQLRSELLSLFAVRCGEAVPSNRQPESPQRPTSNVTWFLGRSPSDVLWQLLHSDFEL